MPITNECKQRLKDLMISAFNNITYETDGLVYFNETSKKPDISLYCESENISKGDTDIRLGDAICSTDDSNKKLITSATIRIYGQGMLCGTGYPALEVHEILHVLGFKHNPMSQSIMQSYMASTSNQCKIKHIDEEYISCLKNIYSNGKINGNCSKIPTSLSDTESDNACGVNLSCPQGWFETIDKKFCCPYENMVVSSEGYCVYS